MTPNTALIEQAFFALQSGAWESACRLCDQALLTDPENAECHLAKLLAEYHCSHTEQLVTVKQPFDQSIHYQKAMQYGDAMLRLQLKEYLAAVNHRIQQERMQAVYQTTLAVRKKAKTEADYRAVAQSFRDIDGYLDARALAAEALEKAEALRCQEVYEQADAAWKKHTVFALEQALLLFGSIPGYRDADERLLSCKQALDAVPARKRRRRSKSKKSVQQTHPIRSVILLTLAICLVIGGYHMASRYLFPELHYREAVALIGEERYTEALPILDKLEDYKDTRQQIAVCSEGITRQKYENACALMEQGSYFEALTAFAKIKHYADSAQKWEEASYQYALFMMEEGYYDFAIYYFDSVGDYRDSIQKIAECEALIEARE